jgi:predicted nucleotidyltransferase
MNQSLDTSVQQISQVLEKQEHLEFAVLIGSQSNGNAHAHSDWDIALRWRKELPLTEVLRLTELLRQTLAKVLETKDDNIDLVDLAHARLAMRALVAEEGKELVIRDELAWVRFLHHTWFELEDHYWREQHAA